MMRSCRQQRHDCRLTGVRLAVLPPALGSEQAATGMQPSAGKVGHLAVSRAAPLEQCAEHTSAGDEQLPTIRSIQSAQVTCWPPLLGCVQASSSQ